MLVAAPAVACSSSPGSDPQIPPLAAAIDGLLPDAGLSTPDLEKVKALRAEMSAAAAAGKEEAAREVEERAMQILGYKKMWLACGRGTFLWMKMS
jgi:hypothetical protein